MLFGREAELARIREFVARAATDGEALVLSGEPGVGKTVLLDAAAQFAQRSGMRVLRASGVEFEAAVSFSTLNQALLPLIGQFQHLAPGSRDALAAALGLADGTPSDRMVVANAALELVRRAAAIQPVLLVVDDLPWVDRASAGVYGFIARRLAGTPIGLIGACRSDEYSFFELAGLPNHQVEPLDVQAADDLVNTRFPDLTPRVRARLLAEAQGNPLALLELPATLRGLQRASSHGGPASLPLNRRIQALFAKRVSELPPASRRLLLAAALDGSGDLRVLEAALAPEQLDRNDLLTAERARLVHVDASTRRLAFQHPLIRSSVVQLSSAAEMRAAHAALAQALAEQPERRAWHLAEAAAQPDEEVAGLLERAAYQILGRGDTVGAVTALARAADLSPGGPDRARRLAEAAYVGADVTGDLASVPQLLAEARRADPAHRGSLQAAAAAAFLLLNSDGDVDTAHRLLVGAIESAGRSHAPDDRALTEALHILLTVCWFGGGRGELWQPFQEGMSLLGPSAPMLLTLCASIFADPARTTADALAELDRLIGEIDAESDPARIVRTGMAAFFVDRMSACREAHWRVVRDGRAGGAMTSAINALIHLSLDDFLTGRWDEAQELAEEGLELCQAHGYRTLAWPQRYALALLAAARGDNDAAIAFTDEMTHWAVPRRAGAVALYASHARALAALGRGDFEQAYQHTVAVHPAGVLPSHVPLALWTAMDAVDAAVRTGRHDEAAVRVATMREANIAAISPRLAFIAAGSAAIAATERDALRLFDEALALPDVASWPFDLARVQLAYGERLRRARATSESRSHLSAALETFERLGAAPWAARAAGELGATGRTRSRELSDGAASLTPQEREIAMLVATGLTNKEVGARLFLSHRTVGAHLARVFRKLDIASRAALRDALAADDTQARGRTHD